MNKSILAFCALFLAASSASACFTVYNANDRVVYQDVQPPVDMSQPLHKTLPGKFGKGTRMVFDTNATCPPLRPSEVARPNTGDVEPGSVQWTRNVSTKPAPGTTTD